MDKYINYFVNNIIEMNYKMGINVGFDKTKHMNDFDPDMTYVQTTYRLYKTTTVISKSNREYERKETIAYFKWANLIEELQQINDETEKELKEYENKI